MKNRKINLHFATITAIVLSLALSRLLPHPFNFSPIAALALFGGVHFRNRFAAYLIPVTAVIFSDFILNYAFYGKVVLFYPGAFFTYLSLVAVVFIGSVLLKRLSVLKLLFTSLGASALFFMVSNFGVWAFSGMYTADLKGLLNCYAAAVPFFRNTFAGDLIYSFAVFYAYAFAESKITFLNTEAHQA